MQLRALPGGLDGVYTQCLRRIENTNARRSSTIASRILKWVSCAKRPLNGPEAREAASMTPDNIPLLASAIINTTVTDYCANLVVLDPVTQTITFAHPTVKEFLSSPDRLPLDLQKYLLKSPADDLWCGEICLAYAKYRHVCKQLVRYQTQDVQGDLASTVVNNTLRDSLPFRIPRLFGRSPKPSFAFPIAYQPVSSADCLLHDYMCKNWLSHNSDIEPSLPQYAIFKDLCLSNDDEIVPVTGSRASTYRSLVDYAVVTDHLPLLAILHRHLKTKNRTLWDQMLQAPSPGTGSSYLHVAAALGSHRVVEVLLGSLAKNLADELGQSPAAVAAQNHQVQIFQLLVLTVMDLDWTWMTVNHEKKDRSQTWKENLLLVCIAAGSVECAMTLMSSCQSKLSNAGVLSEALYHACVYGHLDLGRLLVSRGANVNHFKHNPSQTSLLNGRLPSDPVDAPSLRLALDLDPVFIKTLLALSALPSNEVNPCHAIEVMLKYKFDFEKANTYLDVLPRCCFDVTKDSLWQPCTWLPQMIADSSDWGALAYHKQSLFLRQILHYGPKSRAGPSGEMSAGLLDIPGLKAWFENIKDDVLCNTIRRQWLSTDVLASPLFLNALLQRFSPRALQSAILVRGLQSASSNRIAETAFGARWAADYYFRTGQHHSFQTQTNLSHRLYRARKMHFTLLESYSTNPFLELHLSNAIDVELFELSKEIANAINLYSYLESQPQCSKILWVRCYLASAKHVGDVKKLSSELMRVGSDGNTSLNFPSGYVEREKVSDISVYRRSHEIELAMYGWNYRLNRAQGKAFSIADTWYVGGLLCKRMSATRVRRIWHRYNRCACGTLITARGIDQFSHNVSVGVGATKVKV